jgi:hypothetical protein
VKATKQMDDSADDEIEISIAMCAAGAGVNAGSTRKLFSFHFYFGDGPTSFDLLRFFPRNLIAQ